MLPNTGEKWVGKTIDELLFSCLISINSKPYLIYHHYPLNSR